MRFTWRRHHRIQLFAICLICGFIVLLLMLRNLTQETNDFQTLNDDVVIARKDQQKDDPEESHGNIIDETPAIKNASYPVPNYNLHVFYYAWYGSPEFDGGKYYHWNHPNLPHWNKQEHKRWPSGRHVPPDDIGASFYPELGPYSSSDRNVITRHMQQIREAGIGVLSVSWYPPGMADDQGKPWDHLMPVILDEANAYSLKVCIHIEPYKNRSVENLLEYLVYIHNKYGSHPGYYMYEHQGKTLPLIYIYDSYLIPQAYWSRLLSVRGDLSIRGTAHDAWMISLIVQIKEASELLNLGFDGYYSYFASESFTQASTTRHWLNLVTIANKQDKIFIPSVGPGYIDTRIRPWNAGNTKERRGGVYYDNMFGVALKINPSLISITSFNEWHEGTQIEPSIPKKIPLFTYMDYTPNTPLHYLLMTRTWSFRYRRILKTNKKKVA